MRQFSVPERIGGAGLAAAALAAMLPAVRSATGVALPCPLRTATGIPCPGCGLTTAAEALAAGDPAAAGDANPAVFGLAALTAVGLLALAGRRLGLLPPPVAWSAAARRRTGWLVGALALGSWLFQLRRFGHL
ncbi:MAG TPA: DUF2752 domain-containing protein [Pilimelia sp.]|nr:DUF2752 domain-containing protein [Pilimelia sp.]